MRRGDLRRSRRVADPASADAGWVKSFVGEISRPWSWFHARPFPVADHASRRHDHFRRRDRCGAALSGNAGGEAWRLAIELANSALFWWAIVISRKARLRFAFDADSPDSLVTDGPYFYVRHRFHASHIIFWIGWGIATWSIWAVVPGAGIVAIYTIAALLDEERKFSDASLEYATGFVPVPTTLPPAQGARR